MKRYPKFQGAYAINEFNEIPVTPEMGFIMNLSSDKEKGTHWVAI